MAKTLLQIVVEFCKRTGLDVPTSVIGNDEQIVTQVASLCNEVLEDITNRGESWPRLQKEATFTSVATESQGVMTTLAPYGFQYIVLDTIYDRTARRPIFGPKGAQLWQEAKALPVTGPLYSYRLWQGNLYIQPTMVAGRTCAFEYASNMAVLGTASATDYKSWFDKDTDTFLLDESLILAGLRWKWKAEKGIRYAAEQQFYEDLMATQIGSDSAKPIVNMGGGMSGAVRPGIWVPAGNWPV